jgi:hypothetical protein
MDIDRVMIGYHCVTVDGVTYAEIARRGSNWEIYEGMWWMTGEVSSRREWRRRAIADAFGLHPSKVV